MRKEGGYWGRCAVEDKMTKGLIEIEDIAAL